MLLRWGYSLLLYITLPFLLIRLLGRRDPRYRRHLGERLGFAFSDIPAASIWVHAVSAGEVNAVAEVLRGLAGEGPLLLSMSTPAGRERGEQLQRETACKLHYLPFDCPDMVARSLARVQPKIMITVDTELWPNWIQGCKSRSIPVAVINARMNARSARGYRRLAPLFRPMFSAISLVAAQSESQGQQLLNLGVRPACLQVTGSLKFDAREAPLLPPEITGLLEDGCNLVAGSTHAGEEDLLVRAWQGQPEALRPRLILAPRHVERAEEIQRWLTVSGHESALFSSLAQKSEAPGVIVVDSLGQLGSLYRIADIAFIGGSLVPVGGHNMIEAAAFGKPLLMGPEVHKVQDLVEMFQAEGALRLTSGEQLGEQLGELLRSPRLRAEMGAKGLQLLARHQGAAQKSLELLRSQLADEV